MEEVTELANLVPDEIWALIYLICCTVFMWIGHSKRIMLIELAAFLMMFVGAAWAMTTVMYPMLPILFILIGVLFLFLDAIKGWR